VTVFALLPKLPLQRRRLRRNIAFDEFAPSNPTKADEICGPHGVENLCHAPPPTGARVIDLAHSLADDEREAVAVNLQFRLKSRENVERLLGNLNQS
jgi:hypothetical protein